MKLTLVSIGINSHMDMSLKGVEAARQADRVYAEMYTMKMDTTLHELEELVGKPITPLPRGGMEEKGDELIKTAKEMDVAVLVGGDALSATTHISLLLDAKQEGVETEVIHGSSIFTSITDTGLSIYKFGKTVTVPFPEKGPVDSVLRTLRENHEYGNHTLMLLDLDMAEDRYLSINDAIKRLFETEKFSRDSLLIGVARLGSRFPTIKADTAEALSRYDFGNPPHALIAPGRLHFLEEDALVELAGCPRDIVEAHKVQGEMDRLIAKYTKGCRKVLGEFKNRELPATITEEQVKEMLEHTERYLDDAEYYRGEQKAVALTSVAYAEGILDALKLLGLVEFEW
jgi:diphthine synthase